MRKFIKTLPLKKVFISTDNSRFDDNVDADLRAVLEEINSIVDVIDTSDKASNEMRAEVEKIVNRINLVDINAKFATAFSGLTVLRSVMMGLRSGKVTFLKAA